MDEYSLAANILDEYSLNEYILDVYSLDEYSLDEYSLDQYSWNQYSLDQYSPDQYIVIKLYWHIDMFQKREHINKMKIFYQCVTDYVNEYYM